MLRILTLTLLLACAYAQRQLAEEVFPPQPYDFNYEIITEDGGSLARQEAGDGNGRVTGRYSLQDPDGRNRIVEYIADELGFRATVRTNEEGTESQNPADVVFESSAPTAFELVQRHAATFGSGGARTIVAPAPRPAVTTVVRPAPAPAPRVVVQQPPRVVVSRPAPAPQRPANGDGENVVIRNGVRYVLVPVPAN